MGTRRRRSDSTNQTGRKPVLFHLRVRFRKRVEPLGPEFFKRGSRFFQRALRRSSSSRTAAMTFSGGGGFGSERRDRLLRGCVDLRSAVWAAPRWGVPARLR